MYMYVKESLNTFGSRIMPVFFVCVCILLFFLLTHNIVSDVSYRCHLNYDLVTKAGE